MTHCLSSNARVIERDLLESKMYEAVVACLKEDWKGMYPKGVPKYLWQFKVMVIVCAKSFLPQCNPSSLL
jgi:hypothetical protein